MIKKYLTAFSMTWGNFCTLPCPIKLWDTKCQSLMLGWLPTVGAAIGGIWAACYYLLLYVKIPFFACTFLMTFIPYFLCGFMHMDGFMDCSDAIMSRKPLEDRQRILKDSHTGAFAVISIIFIILAAFSFIIQAILSNADLINFILIAIISRSVSALAVLLSKPIQVSQYVEMQSTTKKDGIFLLLIQLIVYLAILLFFAESLLNSALVGLATALGTILFITYGKKQLGGMNGDIAGYGIVWGEVIGLFILMFKFF